MRLPARPLLIALAVLGLVVLLAWLIETDAERIEALIADDASALSAGDPNPLFDRMLPGFAVTGRGAFTRDEARAKVDELLPELRVTLLDDPDVRINGDRANAFVRVAVDHPRVPFNNGRWPLSLLIWLERDGDTWRYTRVELRSFPGGRRATDDP